MFDFVNRKWVERCNTYLGIEKNYEVEHLTSYQDVNAENQMLHPSLFDKKNGNF